MTNVLKTENLSVHYGGVAALKDVNVSVEAGQLVGLIGPNGAGKTTLVDAVSGFVRAGGRVMLGDEDITALLPHQRTRCGLGRTWQSAGLFDELSVRENLVVATERPPFRARLRELLTGNTAEPAGIERTIALLGLEPIAHRNADELSTGQRKLVGVARALASSPRIVCLDEPAAGLDQHESETLGRKLRQVVEQGTGILLVDHDMSLVLSICDAVIVLDFGKVIARGAPEEIKHDHRVIEAYLGEAAKEVESVLDAEPTGQGAR